jgi:C4-dicarboxylate-specific signal transduction histidine kinase
VRQVGPDGEFAGLLAIGADITAGVRAQLDLQRMQRHLERLMRASVLGELASSLAHELNQPLTAVLANAQTARRLLRRERLDLEQIRAIIDDVIRDDKRAGEIVHGLRAMLRPGEVEPRPSSLEEALREVMPLLQPEFDAQAIELNSRLEECLPHMAVGKVELQQVLLNLLLNAIQAIAGGAQDERSITLVGRRRDGGVEVRVQDSGPGVADDVLRRAFDPLVTTSVDGLGMGLAICRRIVERRGGQIRLQNGANGGGEVTFVLPAVEPTP